MARFSEMLPTFLHTRSAKGTVIITLLFVALVVQMQSERHDYRPADNAATLDQQIIDFTRAKSVDFDPLPDFSALVEVDEMKSKFFDYLEAIVDYQNQRIATQRSLLLEITDKVGNGEPLTRVESEFAQELAIQYELEWDEDSQEEVLFVLERRVDVIPFDLVAVQAAMESGWGRSRFAVDGNNLFGQWCFSEGCGLVPENRSDEAIHEIKYFNSVEESIYSYMLNLNTHPSYIDLRTIRAKLRAKGSALTGDKLADGLIYYSQRREEYVDEVKDMLDQYHEFQSRRTL